MTSSKGLEKGLRKLVVASGNLGKVKEFEEYLAEFDFTLLPKPDTIEVEETGNTFLENAYLKASQVAIATQEWSLADDSGLEVNALNSAPGIYSARYGDSDPARIARLLKELGDSQDRSARFVCAIAVSDPTGKIAIEALGICPGVILTATLGDGGFGYDPIFFLPEHGLTFAQMPTEMKAQFGHRGKALEILLPQLKLLV